MQLVPLLVLLHVGATVVLLVLLAVVVTAQRVRNGLDAHRRVRAAVPAQRGGRPARGTPSSGASVLEWTVDLRGVGQREAVPRT